VADQGRLEPVTFRQDKNPYGTHLAGGLLLVPAGLVLLVLGGRQGKDSLVGAGALLLLLAVILLAGQLVNRNACTTIDRDGVRTSSPVGRRSFRWSEVTDISEYWDHRGDSPSTRHVRIQRSSGRPVTLAVPVDSAALRRANPDFGIQLATIRSYWQNARSSPSGQARDAAP
jgi:hypothetical protein